MSTAAPWQRGAAFLFNKGASAVTLFLFACILHLTGTELPGWAWAFAAGAVTVDLLTNEVTRAFWRGLTGQ